MTKKRFEVVLHIEVGESFDDLDPGVEVTGLILEANLGYNLIEAGQIGLEESFNREVEVKLSRVTDVT